MNPKYYTTEDKNLYYQISDLNPDRQTLVFVHGVFGHSGYWNDYEEHFKDRFNILSIDLRGHGKSYRPKSYKDYNLEHDVEDLKEILKSEGIDKAIFVSASLANFITVRFSALYPQAVEKLLLFTFNSKAAPTLNLYFFRAVFFLLSFVNYFPRKSGNHIIKKNIQQTSDWDLKRLYIDIMNTGFRSTIYTLRSLFNFNIQEDIPKIVAPTLVVNGDKDTILTYKNVLKDMPKFKNAKLITVEGGDHMIGVTHLPEVLRIMDDFLSRKA